MDPRSRRYLASIGVLACLALAHAPALAKEETGYLKDQIARFRAGTK
jgi:hypothetical protein